MGPTNHRVNTDSINPRVDVNPLPQQQNQNHKGASVIFSRLTRALGLAIDAITHTSLWQAASKALSSFTHQLEIFFGRRAKQTDLAKDHLTGIHLSEQEKLVLHIKNTEKNRPEAKEDLTSKQNNFLDSEQQKIASDAGNDKPFKAHSASKNPPYLYTKFTELTGAQEQKDWQDANRFGKNFTNYVNINNRDTVFDKLESTKTEYRDISPQEFLGMKSWLRSELERCTKIFSKETTTVPAIRRLSRAMSATFLNGKSNLERFEIVVKDLQEIQKTSPPEVTDTAVQSSIDTSLVGESSPPLAS